MKHINELLSINHKAERILQFMPSPSLYTFCATGGWGGGWETWVHQGFYVHGKFGISIFREPGVFISDFAGTHLLLGNMGNM